MGIRDWVIRGLKQLIPLEELVEFLHKWWGMEEGEIKKVLIKHGFPAVKLHHLWIDLGFCHTYESIPPAIVKTLVHRLSDKNLDQVAIRQILLNAGLLEEEINQVLTPIEQKLPATSQKNHHVMVFPTQPE